MASPKGALFTALVAIICIIAGLGGGWFIAWNQARGEVEALRAQVAELSKRLAAVEAKPPEVAPAEKIKAAWIYVGPVEDYGWTYGHDRGRRYVAEVFKDWLETYAVPKVSGAECLQVIDKLVAEGYKVIFATSFDFMDATYKAAEKYPDVIFFHCSGYLRRQNMGTYFAEFYQLYYLNGLIAGALTKTGHIGYVAAHPTPEVIRHINAFALGVKEVNPEAKVYVLWIHAWYDPTKARELAETLINKYSCDVLAFTEDTPTVVEVCQEYYEKGRPVYAFAHYSPMLKYGPDVCVSGQLVHWEVIYADILMKIKLGIYTNTNLENVDYWWMLREGAVELGCDYGVPINPKFIPVLKNIIVEKEIMLPNGTVVKNPSVYDLVFIRLAQMMEESPTFDPFTGPIYDQQGNLRVPPGERLGHDALWTMDWFVDNVVGEIPKGGGA